MTSSSFRRSEDIKSKTALDLLKEEERSTPLSTMCLQLNSTLGGGIPLGQITELVGEAGIGKTQICFQLCVTVQLPAELGGANGDAVYIDCEGTFRTNRLSEMVDGSLLDSSHPDVENFTPRSVLSRIYSKRCHDNIELTVAVSKLRDFIKKHPQVKLVIVDSIASSFRQEFEDPIQRNISLVEIMQELCKVAVNNHVAVVLTNQVTTKFSDEGEGYTAAALGETYAHFCGNRIFLAWDQLGTTRTAYLVKSSFCPYAEARFLVCTGGIRDEFSRADVASKESGQVFSASDSSQSQ